MRAMGLTDKDIEAPFVGVASTGLAASAGFSAGFSVFFEVLLLRKPLSLAFKSESAFGAVEARYVSKYKDIKPGREHGCVLYPSPQIDVDRLSDNDQNCGFESSGLC